MASASASAQPRGNAAKARAPESDTVALPAATMTHLRAGSPEELRSAMEDVRLAGTSASSAAPALATRLQRGLPPELAELALVTLLEIEPKAADAPAVAEAVSPYAVHRTLSLRRGAVKLLARVGTSSAVPALRKALSDPDPMVRSLAASGLGRARGKQAVGDLFLALERGVSEAAASIGQLCSAAECERLSAKLGVLPFEVVTSGLEQLLARPPAEVPDDVKVDAIGRVRDLKTPGAAEFLRGLKARASSQPAALTPRVRMELDRALAALGVGS
jgi:hypothetical protein